MIDRCSFGKMAINGQFYKTDLKIDINRKVRDNWRRQEGHLLKWEDIADIVDEDLTFLIIGTGVFGKMKLDKNLIETLKSKNIDYYAAPNSQAADYYNKYYASRETAACFHLTC